LSGFPRSFLAGKPTRNATSSEDGRGKCWDLGFSYELETTCSQLEDRRTAMKTIAPKRMRKIVIAKALILTALGLYLAMGIGGVLRTGADAAHPTEASHPERPR